MALPDLRVNFTENGNKRTLGISYFEMTIMRGQNILGMYIINSYRFSLEALKMIQTLKTKDVIMIENIKCTGSDLVSRHLGSKIIRIR